MSLLTGQHCFNLIALNTKLLNISYSNLKNTHSFWLTLKDQNLEYKMSGKNDERTFHPDPRVNAGRAFASPPPGEEVVITGMAGKFPECESVNELRDALYNKTNLISNDNRRWTIEHPEMVKSTGKLLNIDRFDCGYFGVHYRQATSMDPMLRMVLEQATAAIMDAGYNLSELEGTRTGVFVAATSSETEQVLFFEPLKQQYFPFTGLNRSMLPHRVSYFLKLQGFSHTTDAACSSYLNALDIAYRSIRCGENDAALVAGVNLVLNPLISQQFFRNGTLSKRGISSVFDSNADGYVRSEAIGTLFLQKSKDARRIYAQILYSKTNCNGFNPEGIKSPSSDQQIILFREVLEECEVHPDDLTFLEAHGTGTIAGDFEEVKAIDAVFAKNRTTPLLIGSVKSNVGHSEPASGLTSIIKIIFAMEYGIIPPNINFTTGRPDIEAIKTGRVKVVSEPTPLPDNKGIFGVNNFGFGGTNGQAILKWSTKTKTNHGLTSDNLPRLVCVSGRTEEAICTLLDALATYKEDQEYIRLYHQLFSKHFNNHLYSGYTILTKTEEIQRCIYNSKDIRQPVYLVFGSFSSNWRKVYDDLKEFPTFAQSWQSIKDVLIKKNLMNLAKMGKMQTQKFRFDETIANLAIQICLVDMLKLLDIQPEGTLGIGLGEFICGYFEDCLTLEETIASVYEFVTMNSYDATVNDLASYFVGLMEKELEQLPNQVNIAQIHQEGVILSGKKESLEQFVNNLKNQGVTVKKVSCSRLNFQNNIPSKTKLIKSLSQILTKPKCRPPRWLSTSDKKLASAEFFWESISEAFVEPQLLPNHFTNPIIFEIGTGQLFASSNKSTIINFEEINSKNGAFLLLENLGKLYISGCCMDLAKIYPKVEYPVSRSTPNISSFIKWDHSIEWPKKSFEPKRSSSRDEMRASVDISLDDYTYITGHNVDGRNLFPATGYLYLVWQLLAARMRDDFRKMKIVFRDCHFLRATAIPKGHKLEMMVTQKSAYSNFEVLEKDTLVVSGKVMLMDKTEDHQLDILPDTSSNEHSLTMSVKDVYKEFRLRGYNYTGDFRSLLECSTDARSGKIRWVDNWVTFMDNMLQLRILHADTRGLYVPVIIKQLSIDGPEHMRHVQMSGEEQHLPVYLDKASNVIKSGGIEIRGWTVKRISRKRDLAEPVLEKYQFVPLEAELDINNAVRVNIQLALENVPVLRVKALEVIDEASNPLSQLLAPIIFDALSDLPLIQAHVSVFTKQEIDLPNITVEKGSLSEENECYLIVATKLTKRPMVLDQAIKALLDRGYLLSRESIDFKASEFCHPQLNILTIYKNSGETLVLCQILKANNREPLAINVEDSDTFTWLSKLKEALRKTEDVLIYSQNSQQSGILGLINCIRKEPNTQNTRAVFISDSKAPQFNQNDQFYKQQLKKLLGINVYQNGKWGTYRHLKIAQLNEIECEHCIGNTLVKGDLSSLRWIQGPLKFNTELKPGNTLVHVYYSSLNFIDIMITSGRIYAEGAARYLEELSQGREFVGRDSNGRRVMGITSRSALSNLLAMDSRWVWPVPDHWSMEEAATVPMVYGTLIYAFFIRSSLRRGSSVLIHSGSGGIGQAAIHLCLYYGCKVLTTVGNQEKREFLKKRFPKLTDSVIGNSHDTSFEEMVYRETQGRGVDYVLNSLAEEKMIASVRCLANGGHFLEIGKFDLESDHSLELLLLEKGATFSGIMLDHLDDPVRLTELGQLLQEGISNGSIQPLTRTVFEKEELEKAFLYMTSGKHIGKVMIKIRDEEEQKLVEPLPTRMRGVPRYRCNPAKTAIILGGLGGCGIELADWLVLRGARKLVLTSRTGIKTGYQAYRLRIWESYGVKVQISKADITTKSGCQELITEATQLGAIESIFNLAVVLKDAILENQTEESFKISFAPKAYATRYLDEITRQQCPELRDFVVFSSVSCGRGNGGQTNYGMSNSVMERICEKRKADGYPALAIEWGAIGDVGLVAEMQDEDKILEIGGTLQQRIASCLEVLDTFLSQDDPVVSSIVVAIKKSGGGGVGETVVETVAAIVGISDVKTVSQHATLSELGMDSMSGVEVKQTLEREFQIILSPQEIKSMTFSKLYEIQDAMSDVNEVKTTIANNSTQTLQMLIPQMIDEIVAKSDLIELQTLSNQSQANTSKILLLPGIEGIAKTLLPLSKNLQSRAIAAQYSMVDFIGTIQEMAEDLLPKTLETLKETKSFHIVAYSFGTAVGIEIARLLEAKGYNGNLICIDGGPDLFQQIISVLLGFDDSDEGAFQTNFLCYIMSMHIKQEIVNSNQEAIAKCKSYNERLDIMERLVPADLPFPASGLRKMFLSLYSRIVALRNYKPVAKLKKTNITLFKPTVMITHDLSDDYGLSEYCVRTINVKVFNGNHYTMLEDRKLAEAIDLWAYDTNCK